MARAFRLASLRFALSFALSFVWSNEPLTTSSRGQAVAAAALGQEDHLPLALDQHLLLPPRLLRRPRRHREEGDPSPSSCNRREPTLIVLCVVCGVCVWRQRWAFPTIGSWRRRATWASCERRSGSCGTSWASCRPTCPSTTSTSSPEFTTSRSTAPPTASGVNTRVRPAPSLLPRCSLTL